MYHGEVVFVRHDPHKPLIHHIDNLADSNVLAAFLLRCIAHTKERRAAVSTFVNTPVYNEGVSVIRASLSAKTYSALFDFFSLMQSG